MSDTWTGQGDGWDINDPRNWSLGSVPGAGTTAVFGAGTVSVGYGPDTNPATRPPTPGVFAPAAVSLAAGAAVTLAGSNAAATYSVAMLDIGNGATVSFVDSNLIAGTVDNGGILDLSQALPLGMIAHFSTPQDAVNWSVAHGFGSVSLAAVMGTESLRLVPTGVAYPGKIDVLGANDLGANNAAVADVPMSYGGDLASYVSVPTFPGSGRVVDSLTTPGGLVSPGSAISNWVQGFAGSATPYAAVLTPGGGGTTGGSYTFQTISVPGAASQGTFPSGINDSGEIVGSYIDGAGHEYGFVETSTGFASISVAGAASTSAYGINDLGQVVGTFVDGSGVEHGFLDVNGAISTIDVPGAVGTSAVAINDSGQIVGSFLSPAVGTDGNAAGPAVNAFEYSNGSFTTLASGRNEGIRGIVQPYPSGINDSGAVVGTTQLAPASFPYAWEEIGGIMQTLPSPADSLGFGATGINNLGQIVGYYGVPDSVLPDGAAFIDTAGTLTLVTLPGTPGGINDSGQIVGSNNGQGFLATPLSSGNESAAPCFRAGTGIATERGLVPVEALRPGERVRTLSGRLALVRWVGRRNVALTGDPDTRAGAPIRFAAHALASGAPWRAAWLSPDHAVHVDDILIPAWRLVNGATIRRDATRTHVTYVHVELDRHDILLAEGMAAESYLDTGNRGQFDTEWGMRPLARPAPANPRRSAVAAYAASGCAPLHLEGPDVDRIHARLLRRAEALGWQLTSDPALRITLGAVGAVLCEAASNSDDLTLLVPGGVGAVHIRSRSFVPRDLGGDRCDDRRLGVALAVTIDGLPPSNRDFAAGWQAAEPGCAWRWTKGDAVLALPPCARPAELRIRVMACGARYWVAPDAPAAGAARLAG